MNKRLVKILMAGVSPVFVLMLGGPALAQSTATQAVEGIESVTVTGEHEISGIMKPITVPKERSTISQDFINTQPAGQSIFDMLNKVPGYNFTNNDPYGNSGGNVRIHGFDGNHISFTWDGMPLNDTGNYAIFTNQVADEEVIGSASVNQGTTDVDSPTAAATGGVVSIITARPKDEPSAMLDSSAGTNNYKREFARLDTGEFGPWNTIAFASFSYTSYDKFKGPGYLKKQQFNASLFQDMGELGWVQLAMHWNSNRNNFYNNPTFYPTVSTLAATAAGRLQRRHALSAAIRRPRRAEPGLFAERQFHRHGPDQQRAGFRPSVRRGAYLHPRSGGGRACRSRQYVHQLLRRAHQSVRHRQCPHVLAVPFDRRIVADGGPQHSICAGQWRRLYLAQRNRSPPGGLALSQIQRQGSERRQ